MLNANAQLWVDALRSKRYKQATHRLHNDNGFCCLGVACDLAARTGGVPGEWVGRPEWPGLDNELHFREVGKDGIRSESAASLTHGVKGWLGLRDSVGEIDDDSTLASLNDSGWSFGDIADLIELKADVLFVD
jgi:hypothetical protein